MHRKISLVFTILATLLGAMHLPGCGGSEGKDGKVAKDGSATRAGQAFATPDEGVDAYIKARQAKDMKAYLAIIDGSIELKGYNKDIEFFMSTPGGSKPQAEAQLKAMEAVSDLSFLANPKLKRFAPEFLDGDPKLEIPDTASVVFAFIKEDNSVAHHKFSLDKVGGKWYWSSNSSVQDGHFRNDADRSEFKKKYALEAK